jgi:hypothetical protein
MRKLLLLSALAAGFAFAGTGASTEAQAKPHGWHKGHGHRLLPPWPAPALRLESRPSLWLVQASPAPYDDRPYGYWR